MENKTENIMGTMPEGRPIFCEKHESCVDFISDFRNCNFRFKRSIYKKDIS